MGHQQPSHLSIPGQGEFKRSTRQTHVRATSQGQAALSFRGHPIDAAVSRLAPRERTILRLRFWEDLTQGQIGEVIGISQMQVSRLLADILAKLRIHIDSPHAA